MESAFLERLLQTVIFLLPVLALVWRGAGIVNKVQNVDAIVKEKTEKFEKELKEIKVKAEQERLATDTSISSVMNTLVEIQKSIVRIETKLDIGEKK